MLRNVLQIIYASHKQLPLDWTKVEHELGCALEWGKRAGSNELALSQIKQFALAAEKIGG
jgi:hypothetical protein